MLKISNKEIRNTYTKEFSEYYLVFTRYLPTRIKFITGIEKKQKDFYTMYKIPADSMRKKKNDIGLFDDSENVCATQDCIKRYS